MIFKILELCHIGFDERPSKRSLFDYVRHRMDNLPDEAILLDGACQTGWHISFLFPNKKNYVGIDIDANCISECKQKFPSLQFHCCALENLSSCVSNVDVFVSTNTFCYISFDNIEKIYQELQKVLSDNAVILVSSHFKENFVENIERFKNLFSKYFHFVDCMYYRNPLSAPFEDFFSTDGWYGRTTHSRVLQRVGEWLLLPVEKIFSKSIKLNQGVACYGFFKKNF